jgi:polar amino acid transport system substrate-binding protein
MNILPNWLCHRLNNAALILLLLLSGGLCADQKPIVVAVIQGAADAVAGKAVMLEAYRRIGVPVEFREFSAEEALGASGNGVVGAELERIDGVSSVYPDLVQVSVPINVIQGTAFSGRYRFPVKGWYSLRPYKTGIVKGIVFAEQQTRDMEVQIAENYPELIDWLIDGKIDVGIMTRIQGLSAIRNTGHGEITEMDGVLETLFLYHYVHVSRIDLVDLLTPVLKEMLLSGETRNFRDLSFAAISGTAHDR